MYQVQIVKKEVIGGNHTRLWWQTKMFNISAGCLQMWEAIQTTEWWSHYAAGTGARRSSCVVIALEPGDQVFIEDIEESENDPEETSSPGEKGINVEQRQRISKEEESATGEIQNQGLQSKKKAKGRVKSHD